MAFFHESSRIAIEGLNQDESLQYFYRNLLWRAFEEYLLTSWQAGQEEFGFDEELDTFHPHSHNLRVWHTVVDELVDRIFWDRDWAITSNHPEVLDGMEEELSQPPDWVTISRIDCRK
ncbi:MAG: hypothetical protein KME10_23165 [Plectolyngbya sp. WJT66-NPBG17]|jgi:hypothetical protein|nr:hypothetical protein [Plectolyngbya sp. WJT66-NPBG17]MBW4524482.1 hypothetical protein [Phormidium tanganyikae FI6-MK23]